MEIDAPLVTTIIPTYRRPVLLQRAIRSVHQSDVSALPGLRLRQRFRRRDGGSCRGARERRPACEISLPPREYRHERELHLRDGTHG